MKFLVFFLITTNLLFASNSTESLQKELGIYLDNISKDKCHIYLIHHGSTEWSEQSRLQGWKDLPISLQGKKEINELANRLHSVTFSKIYSSPLQSARETSEILKEKLKCSVVTIPDLRGEYHGAFEGFSYEQYSKEFHFQYYDSLTSEEEIFFPCGQNGESKAEVARRMIPALKKIAVEHLGENIVVVTHGGIFKLLNFYLGRYSHEEGTMAIPNGEMMCIEVDKERVYLEKHIQF